MNPIGWAKREWSKFRGLDQGKREELLHAVEIARHITGLDATPGWKEYQAFLACQTDELYSALLNEEDPDKAESLRQRLRQLEVVVRWRECVVEQGQDALKELEKDGKAGD